VVEGTVGGQRGLIKVLAVVEKINGLFCGCPSQ
jgi:hypothetical protein